VGWGIYAQLVCVRISPGIIRVMEEEEEKKSFIEKEKKLSALLHYVLKGKEIAFTYQDEMVYVGSACCDI
jgi:hypothetical protein